MNRVFVLRALNYLLFLVTCTLIASGLLLEFGFEGGGKQKILIAGIAKHSWEEAHFIIALTFIAFCLIHILLNWSWIVKVATHQKRLTLLLSLGLGLMIIIAPFLLPKTPQLPHESLREGAGDGPQMRMRQHRPSE